jgi:DNA-directed RNA polymerase subunit M
MEFCPECRAILFPNEDGELKCKTCGYSSKSENIDYSVKIEKIESEETVKVLGEEVDMRSTIKETCPECGHDEAYYELKQTRSADEAPTRIFTCAKCKHTWRAYH